MPMKTARSLSPCHHPSFLPVLQEVVLWVLWSQIRARQAFLFFKAQWFGFNPVWIGEAVKDLRDP
jgi:hypothetical protein